MDKTLEFLLMLRTNIIKNIDKLKYKVARAQEAMKQPGWFEDVTNYKTSIKTLNCQLRNLNKTIAENVANQFSKDQEVKRGWEAADFDERIDLDFDPESDTNHKVSNGSGSF